MVDGYQKGTERRSSNCSIHVQRFELCSIIIIPDIFCAYIPGIYVENDLVNQHDQSMSNIHVYATAFDQCIIDSVGLLTVAIWQIKDRY